MVFNGQLHRNSPLGRVVVYVPPLQMVIVACFQSFAPHVRSIFKQQFTIECKLVTKVLLHVK